MIGFRNRNPYFPGKEPYMRLLLALLVLPLTLFCQPELTIPEIMQGEQFVGHAPTNFRWSLDSKTIYFDWNPTNDTLDATFRVDARGGDIEKCTLEELRELPSWGGNWDQDYERYVYSKNGDLFLYTASDAGTKQLTNTVSSERSPRFSGDGTQLIYQSGNNLFAHRLADGYTEQLTNFVQRKRSESSDPKGYKGYLQQEATALSEILQERKATREARTRQREALEPKRPVEIPYGGKRVGNLVSSPDGRFVNYRLTSLASERTEVPQFVTEDGFVEMESARSKVGSPQSSSQSWIYDRQRDTFYEVTVDNLPDIRRKPVYQKQYHEGEEEWVDTTKAARKVIIHGPYWNEDGSRAAMVVRSLDNKDRWITLLDPEAGTLHTIEHQHDTAWIGGPGISSWNFSGGVIGWLPDNLSLYYQSEETGYSHLYRYDTQTNERRALTSGEWEVQLVRLSRDGQSFYIQANRVSPHEQHYYQLDIASATLTQLTVEAGGHNVVLSPDEQYLADRFSYSNAPWELYVQAARAGAERRRITRSTTTAFDAYPWRQPQIVRFTANDGVEVPARLYQPEVGSEGGPAVIFVHGAGYLQNVHRWWSSYYREYLFHNLLVDAGYTVLDIDYRASAGYGRDWRTAIYRHMGGRDLQDQVDGANYLVEELGIDPDRIGIYGGSYGGFITLMALFNHPGTFKAGAALRSVTDWAHYNHGYTSNILNTPVEDKIAFERSSPIYFAEGLEDRLLILHGMVDDNVQFQDVVRLAQRLIELGKDHWEFAVFPLEPHGFREPSSWADEYRRIFELFESTIGLD